MLPAFPRAKGMKTEDEIRIYEFNGFRLDARQRLLWHQGKRVALPPKTLHLLVVLVQSEGRLLEKDELLKSVWPDTFVEEAALAKGIHLLRKTLGESAIVTVPKRGYSFAAALTEVEIQAPGELRRDEPAYEPISAEPDAVPIRRRSLRTAWVSAAALALSALALSPRSLWNRPARIGSVAVLPFQSALGQDPLLAAGFTQELAARLRTLPGLRVVSPLITADIRELGARLGVETVLTGTLQSSGSHLRASAQLLSA